VRAGHRHFRFENGVEIVEQSISGRCCPETAFRSTRGSGPDVTKGQADQDATAVGPAAGDAPGQIFTGIRSQSFQ